ncbi:hypothetical protein TNCV_996511 [Trichonephila clavipes]|nr:hypothetical protein TNCV_996511 [Trichonephila clavipes]
MWQVISLNYLFDLVAFRKSKYLVSLHISRAQVSPTGEETRHQNYIGAIGIHLNGATLKRDTSFQGMHSVTFPFRNEFHSFRTTLFQENTRLSFGACAAGAHYRLFRVSCQCDWTYNSLAMLLWTRSLPGQLTVTLHIQWRIVIKGREKEEKRSEREKKEKKIEKYKGWSFSESGKGGIS